MKTSRQTDSSQDRESRWTWETQFSLAWLHQRSTPVSTDRDLGRGIKRIYHLNFVPPHTCTICTIHNTCFGGCDLWFSLVVFEARAPSWCRLYTRAHLRRDMTLRISCLFRMTSMVSCPFFIETHWVFPSSFLSHCQYFSFPPLKWSYFSRLPVF